MREQPMHPISDTLFVGPTGPPIGERFNSRRTVVSEKEAIDHLTRKVRGRPQDEQIALVHHVLYYYCQTMRGL